MAKFFEDEKDFDKLRWDVITSKDWKNSESDISRREFKQAEFLIHDFMPVKGIESLVVKTTKRKENLEQIINELSLNIPVYIDTTNKLFY